MSYDLYIYGQEAWDDLVNRGLDVVIDPLVLRTGQFFLEGPPQDPEVAESRWSLIEQDVGALAAFIDLVVMRRQFPAFNYEDTFDPGPNIGDPLGDLVNTVGDKVLYHVDVEHHMYREAKAAALHELQRGIGRGGVVTEGVADEIIRTTTAMKYEWSPSLDDLAEHLATEKDAQIARYLLGQLVFAGYAQQTGAPHVLSPGRSRIAAAVGVGSAQARARDEANIYDELRRRSKDAGDSWRVRDLPWTPTFLPYLVQQMQGQRFRAGPDVLLELAKELRETPAVERYRALRRDFLSGDGADSGEAQSVLEGAADAVARSLNTDRGRLDSFGQLAVEMVPAGAGAVVGAAVAGPLGAVHGAVVGELGKTVGRLVVDKLTVTAQDQLFGWYVSGLTRRSARKLLTRALRTDLENQSTLRRQLRIIWESPLRTR
ncbi:UNVERIFIED_ORG: hypothetical protein J2X79_004297 [Arthrobacter globiformis]|nr:hypothetical protein [Arthrobacter globiformis]